jgi:HNH endonuclease/AP2 domain
VLNLTEIEKAKFWQYTYVDKSTKTIREANKRFGHCWIWKGHLKNKYGYYSYHEVLYRAHLIAYQIVYGEIPENVFVCHKCDNPTCVNPLHLFLGAPKENTLEMISKSRLNRSGGENKGVTYRKETGKWRARYMRDYKNILVGEFDTEEEALSALQKARETPWLLVNLIL